MLHKIEPLALEAKTFAVGVRVEHPRYIIDNAMYHSKDISKQLGAAEYRFTSQQEGRGVYSFCMCPGGFIVPSATKEEQIVINGMSAAGRNSAWSNAAFVVEIYPEDIPLLVKQCSLDMSLDNMEQNAIAGLLWREAFEHITFLHGSGQKAPAQRLEDFLSHKESLSLPKTSYAPGIVSSRLDDWLPAHIENRLEMAFKQANKTIRGFISKDALLVASETRTSTPVRILRDKTTGQNPFIKGLYPAGEGSGYAGGIVSSAMDGIKQCTIIAQTEEF